MGATSATRRARTRTATPRSVSRHMLPCMRACLHVVCFLIVLVKEQTNIYVVILHLRGFLTLFPQSRSRP